MKLMISQPMKGKTQEQIQKEREPFVKKLEEQGHTVVDSFLKEAPPDYFNNGNSALWCLAKSLEKMSECDGVVFLPGWQVSRGCILEHSAAENYGLFVKSME